MATKKQDIISITQAYKQINEESVHPTSPEKFMIKLNSLKRTQ